ncbi:MAG: phytanoyl-CoA dioxygenase family protein [Deltaproteobacteria bacterium]|nr:phytanoyl-CoA dioxygenase family protein [Deltaproteobacteria bacterium]
MRDVLTPEHVQFYQEHGYVVVEDLIDAAEVEELRALQTQALSIRGQRLLPWGETPQPGGAYARMSTQRLNVWMDVPGYEKYARSPIFGRMAARLAGVPGMRVWHDQIFVKPPWGSPTGWHHDSSYWSYDHPGGLTMWIALDETSLQNGALHFMPGTHRETGFDVPDLGELSHIGALFDDPRYARFASRPTASASLKPGSASFHSGMTLHAAGANMTPHDRRAWLCCYMPDGQVFNGKPNVLPPELLGRLQVGDPLDDPSQCPLVWREGA